MDAAQAGIQIECPGCRAPFVVPRKSVEPGVTVGGFKISRLLGQGGMGEVYLARQVSLDRDVALKILSPQLCQEPEERDRFLNEMRVLARLDHRNIVTAHDAGVDSGVLYLAMAYLSGDSTEKRIKKDGPYPEAEALKIAHKMADALAYAWDRHQLLHLDIKPANILTDSNGETKLADFGLARRLAPGVPKAEEKFIIGSPNYMSPEQAGGVDPLDCRSDIYSLGATLYTLVTGTLPFESPTAEGTFERLAKESLPDPRERVPTLSRGLVLVMERMLARDRRRRYGAWPALIEDLRRVQANRLPKTPGLAARESVLKRRDLVAARAGAPGTARLGRNPPTAGQTTGEEQESRFGLILAVCAVVAAVGAVWWYAAVSGDKPAPPPPRATFQPQAAPAETSEEIQAREFGKRFDAGVRYEREHPGDYAGAIALFDSLRRDGVGTHYESAAAERIRRIDARRAHATEEALAGLRTEAVRLSGQGNWEQAVALVRDYAGPMKEESAGERQTLVEDLTRRAGEARKKSLESAQTKLGSVVNDLAARLANLDFAAVQRRMAEADRDAALDSVAPAWKAVRESAARAAALPDLVVESFRRDAGKEIRVILKRGIETLQIAGIEGAKIKANLLVRTGELGGSAAIARDFTLDDLSVKEKMGRIGSPEAPDSKLLRGLLLCEGKELALAKAEFEGCPGPMGQALVRQVERLAAEQAAAAAQDAYRNLLAPVFPAFTGNEENEAVIAKLSEIKLMPGQAKTIRTHLDAWNLQFANTDVGLERRDVIDALNSAVAAAENPGRAPGFNLTAPNVVVETSDCTIKRTRASLILYPDGGRCKGRVTLGEATCKGNYRIRWRVKFDAAQCKEFRIACWPFLRNPRDSSSAIALVWEDGAWSLRGPNGSDVPDEANGYSLRLSDSLPKGQRSRRETGGEICFEKVGEQLFASVDSRRVCAVAMNETRLAKVEDMPLELDVRARFAERGEGSVRLVLQEFTVGPGVVSSVSAEPGTPKAASGLQ